MLAHLFASFKKINLANRITLFRVGIILPILLLLYFPTKLTTFLACICFIFASVSDFVDGYIARKTGQVTTLGKFLDPLADKLLICTVLVAMTSLGWVSSWVVNIIVVRELAVTGLRAVAADNGVVLSADTYGKWKTTFQLLAIIPLLFHYPYFGIPMHEIGTALLYVALFFTVLSGVNYFLSFYKDICKSEY